MIIKEYRIPMPLAVEDYRIAQLYMIAKKSRLESQGDSSGVEIIKNEPYSNGPGGNGQYTDKVYYIGSHLPAWARPLLPRALATVREEAWNAYPYSKNSICCPNLDKFTIEIESKYLPGGTRQENVFELTDEEKSDMVVDVIDFAVDKLSGSDYLEAEDPLLYKSEKNQAGPLDEDWLTKYEELHGKSDNEQASNKPFMCVYKLVKVYFGRWPVQYRVESFIHDYLRKALVRSHRQAWAWQDEWKDLNMEQIREMEEETQKCLAKLIHKEDD